MLERVALGCGGFGGIGSAPEFFGQGESEAEAFALMDVAWELGIRWFDTADAYGGGRSETMIGRWIAVTGNRPRITTKTFNPINAGEDAGLAPARVLRQLESSLERLGVERVDFYLGHEWDAEVPFSETLGAFERLVEQGLVTAWGLSNVGSAEVREALGHGRPALVQNSYSLLEQGDADEVIPLCQQAAIDYQAFSPLAGGWLTGKYQRGEAAPAGSRMTLRPDPYRKFDRDDMYEALASLGREAAERRVSMAGLALAWLLAHEVSIVVGPRNPAQLKSLREALTLQLEVSEREQLAGLFAPVLADL